MTLKEEFRQTCVDLLTNGIKPTPTELEKHNPRFVRRKEKNITLAHGRYAVIRREEFLRAGWRKAGGDYHDSKGHWEPPLHSRSWLGYS